MKRKEADHADEKKVRIGAKPKISSILSLIFAAMIRQSRIDGIGGCFRRDFPDRHLCGPR